jgi:hypothetical protein
VGIKREKMKIAQNVHKSILRAKLFTLIRVLEKIFRSIWTIDFFNDFQHLAKFRLNSISVRTDFEKVEEY